MDNFVFTLEDAIARIKSLHGKPIAVQALWDGDTHGWFLMMDVIMEVGLWGFKKHQVHGLGILSSLMFR